MSVQRLSPTSHHSEVELRWANKELRPVRSGNAYRWVAQANEEATKKLAIQKIVGCAPPESLLIGADASDALAALAAPELGFLGNVNLCYLDPPFNTGERFEHYGDKLDRSMWLGVLREHLSLIKGLLAPNGSVWLHLDDSEQHRARCVLDEVFGADAFVGTIIWQKRTSRDSRKAFSSMHDYIHVYSPIGPTAWKQVRNGLPDEGEFANPDNDPRGPWRSIPMTVQAGHATASQFYTVVTPTGVLHDPPAGRCWTYTQERLDQLVREKRVYWPRKGDGKPRLKRFATEATDLAPFTIWPADEVGDTSSAKKNLRRDFPDWPTFDTPKPLPLMQRIVGIASDAGDLVLDCYAGSGTTLAAAESMKRRWVGVDVNDMTLERFAIPRLSELVLGDGASGFGIAHCE